ncbi:MAG: BRCT domain-containing protein [Gammaproteobacteria bacterium]|nr:BRCT domain-containing protein [Gammaproteobacteria bacterium]
MPALFFCLTGDFVTGDRNSVNTMLRCLGAETKSSVNKSVDYLVIGTLASRDWLYTSHGRKIVKALLIKREGCDIKVIAERTLL